MEESEESRGVKQEEGSSEQEIWSWGAGTDGQLGTGRLQDEHLPQLLHLPSLSSSAGSISFLACGGAHVLALTSGGKVLTWGRGTSGQLGHGDMNSPDPMHVMSLNNFFITHVSARWNHSGFVSDAGDLFTCGDGSFGQLGHGDFQSHCCPVKVSFFVDKHVEQIACGMRHSLVLLKGVSGDEVYGFGSGKHDQLGISKDKIKLISLPERTCRFEGVKIASIAANGDHSAALSAEGHLYTWGRDFGGNLTSHRPQRLPTLFSFTKVAVGWNHALVLAGAEVLMLGGNHHGVLSNPEKMTPVKHLADSKEVVMEKIPGLGGSRIVQIAAGAEHSAIVTEDGGIKTWGWGEHGQLGLGNTDDQTSPQEVSFGHKFREEAGTIEIYCGSGFTIAIRTSCRRSQTD